MPKWDSVNNCYEDEKIEPCESGHHEKCREEAWRTELLNTLDQLTKAVASLKPEWKEPL